MCKANDIDSIFMNRVAIYGAQMVAVSVYYALKALYPDCEVIAFVVSEHKGNPLSIDGVPVVALRECIIENVQFVIATPENHHDSIIHMLENRGIKNYQCIDSKLEAALMEKYYSTSGKFLSLHSLNRGEAKASLSVYLSKFYKDQALKGEYKFPDWIHPLQAGAALTDIRVAAFQDNEGDNISYKNSNYSELTVMYWIAKHADDEYLGLFHYRRILDVTEEDLYRFIENDIDVILPYPTIHYPNIYEHHKRYLKEADWKTMLQVLHECAPGYMEKLPNIFQGQYFYNYNMLIAKKKVFREYCDWLFPILSKVEKLSIPKGSERADRYIGYLGENLTTLYFMAHEGDLKIAHTGRLMLT